MRSQWLGLVLVVGGLLLLSPAALADASKAPSPDAVRIKWDGKADSDIRHLRTSDDPIPATEKLNPAGLSALHASGSDQFTLDGLRQIHGRLSGHPVYVVDLRQESHGFLNGRALSWFGPDNHANLHRTQAEVVFDEKARLAGLQGMTHVEVYNKQGKDAAGSTVVGAPQDVSVTSVLSEAAAVERLGWHYLRLTVPDHMRPDDGTVDQFLAWTRSLPADAWVHFHCAGGRGRTSTFMTMWDMLHNAGTVSMGDILTREAVLGGSDLQTMPAESNEGTAWAADRLHFLETFYRYCQANPGSLSWSQWLAADKSKP